MVSYYTRSRNFNDQHLVGVYLGGSCCQVIRYIMLINELIEKTIEWHHARNLIDGANDKDQYMKLIQECGELSDNICTQQDIRDDIGDIMVVLINIAERNGVTLEDCLAVAYDDIKDRKGKMVDGVFIKEEK